MASKCRCGNPATHIYAGDPVCASHYTATAEHDDGPGRIPENYDWDTEMKSREIK